MTNSFSKREPVLIFVMAVALSFLIFGNGIKDGFIFDDTAVIEKRGDLKDFSNFFNLFISPYHQNTPQSGLYRPFTMATYSLNYAILGQSPKGFHIINILIHALNSFLVFWLVSFLFNNRRMAYFSFFLFLAHPIHTEAVTSIVGRAELLAFFWGFVCVYFFLRKRRFLSAVSFLLALWSKESALMILPLILYVDPVRSKPRHDIGAADAAPHRTSNGVDWTRVEGKFVAALRNLIFFVFPLAVYAVFRFVTLGRYFISENLTTLVENPLKFVSLPERVWTALKVLSLYLEKLVWPAHLSADYSFNTIKLASSPLKSPEALLGLLFLLLIIFLAFYRRTKNTVLGFGSAVFLFPYLMVSNLIIPIGTIMGERLIYFSSFGFVVILAVILCKLGDISRFWKKFAIFILVLVLVGWGIRTVVRNKDWLNNRALFSAALKESPDGLLVRTGMAAVRIRDNEWAEAEKELEIAQRIYKDNSHEQNLLGIIAEHKGDSKSAEERYKESIRLGSNPVNTHINLSNLYLKRGRYDEAGQNLLKVVEFNPIPEYVIRYGYVQIAMNKPNDALATVNKYFGNKINDKELNSLVGTAYFVKKDYQKALDYLSAALSQGKDNPEIENMINISKQNLGIK